MKYFWAVLSLLFVTVSFSYAQTGRTVSGTVTDSTKVTIPGCRVELKSDKGDSLVVASDPSGKFVFSSVNGTKITLKISSIGYDGLIKHYVIGTAATPIDLGNVVLKTQTNTLNQVNVVAAAKAIVFKEDTTEYNASAYKVRENAPVEDLIKKLPGVDVDVNGNITTQGKQVTKVRINGKDFMGGDVQSATKNLPADVVENIQMIDDYGDQANLTGVKTGEPDKIMNITIRKDKNYGYFGQATAGDGEDLLPADNAADAVPGSTPPTDQNRYLGSVNFFRFNGDQQIAILGSINNTNVNTFSFGSSGGGGGFGGGGLGRGNAGRAALSTGTLITTQNGLTDAHSLGANFRDQWGKYLSVYGSYSFSDNTVATNSFNRQTNYVNGSQNNQFSNEYDRDINHRFTWNMEYKPDTINYVKITPTFTYSSTNTTETDSVNNIFPGSTTPSQAYSLLSNSNSSSPNYGLNILYNHRFIRHGRNFSINVSLGSTTSNSYQNPIYDHAVGFAPEYQVINTNSRTNSIGTSISYLEPLGKFSYLEFNYAFNHSHTTNDKQTDTAYDIANQLFNSDTLLSTQYNYTFTTNKFGLNYRFIQKKYNYTLGIGVQPAVLNGYSPLTNLSTHVNTFDVIPTARYVYNFSRSQSFSVNYNGSSSAPSFTQLQPTIDYSNALYPVQGNPDLKPQFTNNFSVRYNKFSFDTGDVLFTNISFQDISNQAVTNSITYVNVPQKQGVILTQYLNANGYYNANANLTYAKPWEERKYTLFFSGSATYSNNIGYLTTVTPTDSIAQKNIAKNLALTPGLRFRVDITDVIDAQALTSYTINKTENSVSNTFTNGNSNIRTWSIGLNGKNYIWKDWTFSYDYTKAINYGYASDLHVTNPNLLNVYVERRFLKNNIATIRLSVFDLFNQNAGFASSTTASSLTETNVNRLSRYYLATFTLNLKKFAGKAPTQDPGRDYRRNGGNGPGGPGGGPGGGGPGGGGPGGGGGGGGFGM